MLSVATSMVLRTEGNESAANLIKEITNNSPERANKILRCWKDSTKNIPRKYTCEEALSFLIENNLTKKQYEAMYREAKSRNFDIYPSYGQILKMKKMSYPTEITISEQVCETSLQSLLNHTCSRLLEALHLPADNEVEKCSYLLVCKYGFDGSSGHSAYKQTWNENNINDESLFITCLVPLKLQDSQTQRVLWDNPRLASVRFCRPVKLQWIRETDEIIRQEKGNMDNQISRLQPFETSNCKISFSIHLTMLDGKVTKIIE